MSIPFTLNATLSRSVNADPGDILRTKQALNRLGHYSMPSYGLTEYPDEPLFQGLETFQDRYGLNRDGIMKSGGETAAVLGVEATAALILKIGFPAPSGLVAVVQEYRSAQAATARALNELDARRADVEDCDVEIRRLTNELSGLGC